MKIKASIRAVLLILASLWATPTLFSQTPKLGQGYEPIINHEPTLHTALLLSLSAIEKDSRKLASQDEADKLFVVTQVAVKGQSDVDAKIAPNNTLYKDSMALLQYFMSHVQLRENRDRIKIVAEWMENSAQIYGETSKKPDLQAQAFFYSKIGKYLRTGGTDGTSELIPLKEKLQGNKDLLNSIDLLVGHSLAISPTTSAQGLQTMAKVGSEVSIYGRVAIKLTEAVIDYGLDADGAPLTAVKAGAEAKLTFCVQLARGMPLGLQHLVMDSASFIWTRANPNKSTHVPAFLKEGFPGILPVDFLREHEALVELAAGNYRQTSTLYKKIAEAYPRGDQLAAIDSRIWDMELLVFQKSGQLSDLEPTYLALRQKYSYLGKKGFYASLGDAYRKNLDATLDLALNPKTSRAALPMAIAFTVRYLKSEADRVISAPLKTKLALVYRTNKMYTEAVDLYVDLAKEAPLKNYVFAIEAQSQLAGWPNQPVFTAPSTDKIVERTRLLSFYEIISQLKKGEDWFATAHMGLLQRAIGQQKTAELLWMKALKTNASTRYSQEAGGLLLSEFFAKSRWDDVVEITHLFANKKVAPIVKGAAFNYKPYLADALYKGGTSELGKQSYPKAAKYLEEFTIVFPTEPRYASAGYSLALAYKAMNKLVPALNVSKNITEKFPTYALRPKLILQAAEWAASDKTTLEYSFYFYTKYLNDYKNEANIPTIRVILAELYFKRKLYGWASRLYREQSLSPKVAKDLQLVAAVRAMDIEDKFGEAREANRSALRIIDIAGPKDPARYRAFAFMGRYVADRKDLAGMNAIEPKLLDNSKNSKEIVEAIGYLRFRRAEMLVKPIVFVDNNLQLKDPDAAVRKYYARFEDERKNYLNVCQIGITQYCAPALLKLTAIARQAVEALDKIQIPETLGPSRVNGFKVFKQLQVSRIQQARKDYTDQAVRLAKQGTTTPPWKEEIVKTFEYEEEQAH